MATIPSINDAEAVVEIQKVIDETAPKGNTKSRIASILNYLNLKTGGFIPLTGTEEGKPVTGTIEVSSTEDSGGGNSSVYSTKKDSTGVIVSEAYLEDNVIVGKYSTKLGTEGLYFQTLTEGQTNFQELINSGVPEDITNILPNKTGTLSLDSYLDYSETFTGKMFDGKPVHRAFGNIEITETPQDVDIQVISEVGIEIKDIVKFDFFSSGPSPLRVFNGNLMLAGETFNLPAKCTAIDNFMTAGGVNGPDLQGFTLKNAQSLIVGVNIGLKYVIEYTSEVNEPPST